MTKQVWLCPACGKVEERKEDFGDVSCYVNAVKVDEGKVVYSRETGRAIRVEE